MIPYVILPGCLRDIDELLAFAERQSGKSASEDLEKRLFAAIEQLATFPGIGHRRSDLTSRPYFFYTADPYLIIHARGQDPMPILAVFHSSRDIKRLLRSKRFK